MGTWPGRHLNGLLLEGVPTLICLRATNTGQDTQGGGQLVTDLI